MPDIVERLREDARGGMAYHELSDEAADEIERLRQENERLREALDEIETMARRATRHHKDVTDA